MQHKYHYHEELRHVWDQEIIAKKSKNNVGFFAPCCNSFYPRSRQQNHKIHAIHLPILTYLRNEGILTFEDFVKHMKKSYPYLPPVVGKKYCFDVATGSVEDLTKKLAKAKQELEALKTFHAQSTELLKTTARHELQKCGLLECKCIRRKE